MICDKPITNTLAEAQDVLARVNATGLVFCLTHNYTGYPMVRQARAMVDAGELGEIRLVQVEYVQGGKASENDPDPADGLPWRYDPVKGGPSLVMGDIGSHAHNLTRFITGLEVEQVAAEVGAIVPNRLVDDFAAAMLRFDNGARGSFGAARRPPPASRTASGSGSREQKVRSNGNRSGSRHSASSHCAGPPRSGPPTAPELMPLRRGRPDWLPATLKGSLEHSPQDLAHSDAAEAIAARRTETEADPSALHYPNAIDGAWGVRFVEAAIESATAGGAWTNALPRALDR